MDKYYTPVIEEFHIGFEYEDRQFRPVPTSMGIAKRRIFGTVTLDTIKPFWQIKKDIEDGDIRVKYLDKEDIESLGFSSKSLNIPTKSSYYKVLEDDTVYKITVFWDMLFNERENLIRVFKGKLHDYPYEEVFRGDIKNKSELKRILKQLNIKL